MTLHLFFLEKMLKFEIFKKMVKSGSIVRAIVTKNTKDKPRSFFDNLDKWAKDRRCKWISIFHIRKK